ncbi:MAG: YesL family protein [Eubacterium sp.]|nr:YesL family protein [Eubacterium sp.]
MGFLRYDSDFMLFLGRLADLMWLNILCLICSIPIVTFGAAVSAKYYTAMKLERGEATGVTKAFFHSFKQNLIQNTWLSIIVIVVVFLFGWNWLLVYGGTLTNTIVIGLLSIFSVMFAITVFCMFPMLARFEATNFAAFRNALVFGIVHLPRVVIGVAVSVAPLIIGYYNFKWLWLIWLGISTLALYYNAIFFIKKFQILEEKTFGEVQNPYDPDHVPSDDELKPLSIVSEDEAEDTDEAEESEAAEADDNAEAEDTADEAADNNDENNEVSDDEVEK